MPRERPPSVKARAPGNRKTPRPTTRRRSPAAAQKPVSDAEVIPSPRHSPHLEFVDRVQGTLPEIVTEADLDTLNSALSFLFSHLREARRRFDQENDNGRFGAFTALGGLWQFVVLFDRPCAENLQVPILRLQDALHGLDNNLVSPIVKPIKRRGRAPSSYAHATLRGHTAGTVKILMDIGLSRTHAHREVAKLLANLGVRAERGSGGLTAATVRNWCDEVSRDVGRHGTAAQQYDFWIERPEEQRKFTETSKDEAKRYALASLTGWVQSLFPELRKAT